MSSTPDRAPTIGLTLGPTIGLAIAPTIGLTIGITIGITIGLTGGIGSGKSTVAREFEARGIVVVDADAIAHQLTAPGGMAIDAIRQAFGPDFIDADGAMNRARMRAHIFAEPVQRAQLEAILHPLIRKETARQADAATSPYRMLMIPLLVESRERDPDWRTRFDRILAVDCTEATQIARVMARSGLTEAAVRAIMAAQVPRAVRVAAADDVIDNDGEVQLLPARVALLHQQYLALASRRNTVPDSGNTA